MNFWPLLAPFSYLYGYAVILRNLAYDSGLLPAHKVKAKVFSIGNISAGGTGKTPVTMDIGQRISQIVGCPRTAVVSRGYGRETRGVRIVSDFNEILLNSKEGGDEPLLIAESLPGVPVIVSEHRWLGAALATNYFKSKYIILDDAFQHRSLQRDINFVLIDETVPAWQWRLLPAGRMREPGFALKRASIIGLTGGGTDERREVVTSWIRKYTDVPVIAGKYSPGCLRPLHGKLAQSLETLKGKKVAAVCGIANPDKFIATIESLGAIVVYKKFLGDHAAPDKQKLEAIIDEAASKDIYAILVTQKDAVKFRNLDTNHNIQALEMDWNWYEGIEKLDKILASFCEH